MTLLHQVRFLAGCAVGLAVVWLLPTAAHGLLDDPTDLAAWWEREGTASAAMGLLHLAALAAGLYVSISAALLVVADRLAWAGTSGLLAAITPTALRRHLAIGAATAALALPGLAAADEAPIVVADAGVAVGVSPIVLTDVGPADATSVTAAAPSVAAAEPATDALAGAPSMVRDSFRAAPLERHADSWLVEEGEHLWAIAEQMVEADAELDDVDGYWRALIEANPTLADPDLIFPGQTLRLPSPLTAGS